MPSMGMTGQPLVAIWDEVPLLSKTVVGFSGRIRKQVRPVAF